jgi:hypothetical protein
VLETRAPRKGTLAVAVCLYLIGFFGALGAYDIPQSYVTAAFAISGGLLILSAFLPNL